MKISIAVVAYLHDRVDSRLVVGEGVAGEDGEAKYQAADDDGVENGHGQNCAVVVEQHDSVFATV